MYIYIYQHIHFIYTPAIRDLRHSDSHASSCCNAAGVAERDTPHRSAKACTFWHALKLCGQTFSFSTTPNVFPCAAVCCSVLQWAVACRQPSSKRALSFSMVTL